jgi:hypothetical protein
MSFFKTAYDTTVGRGFVSKKIVDSIRELLIVSPPQGILNNDQNKSSNDKLLYAFITGRPVVEANIPSFAHPIEVVTLHPLKQEYLAIDVRPFVRVLENNGEVSVAIKNKTEYTLARARLAMAKIWMTSGPDALSGFSTLPCSIFSSWISENVRHRFVLDPADQLKMAIVAAFYYQTLFVPDCEFSAEQREQFNAVCIRALKAPAKIVFETTDKITKLENISDFCETVKVILENPRLENFNAGLLITILKNTWFGTNSAEMLGVSLEYPPTWISLVYASMSERTYRDSNLAKIAERYSKRNADNFFTRGFVSLAQTANSYIGEDNSF